VCCAWTLARSAQAAALVAIGSSGTIGTSYDGDGSVVVYDSGASLDVDGLGTGGDCSILSAGYFSTGGRCSSDGSSALATGKCSGILSTGNSDILGHGWSGSRCGPQPQSSSTTKPASAKFQHQGGFGFRLGFNCGL
jgi:hypothetical protein